MPQGYAPLKEAGGTAEQAPLQSPAIQGAFVEGPRQVQDREYGVVFCVFIALVTGLGGIFIKTANRQFFDLTHAEVLDLYDTCHAPADANGRRVLAGLGDIAQRENTRVRTIAAVSLVTSAIGAVVLGLLFITLLQRNAPAVVRVTMLAQLFLPLFVGCGLIAAGAIGSGAFWILLGALWAYVIYLWMPQLKLVGQLLGVAAHALGDNKHLITGTLLLNVAVGVAVAPLVTFFCFAYATGDVIPSPWANRLNATSQKCIGQDGKAAPCCAWMPTGGAVFYMATAMMAMSWLVFFAFEVRLYTVSHVVGRWYYLPLGQKLPGWPVVTALKTALGPAFGTLSLGSAILAAADAMRRAAQAARDNSNGNGFAQCITCICSAIVSCIAEILSQLTKFTTVRAALSGEAFFEAARNATDLLARNFLDSFAVWRFPPMVLTMVTVVTSGVFGVIAYFSYSLAVGTPTSSAAVQLASQASVGVGVAAGVLSLVSLSLMTTIILNVVDAVYLCFAYDKDRQLVTRPEVHHIFVLIPAPSYPAEGVPVRPHAAGPIGYHAGNNAPRQMGTPQYTYSEA